MIHKITTRTSMAVIAAAAVIAGSTMLAAGTQKFYPDDPITQDPERQDASHVKRTEVDHVYAGWQAVRGTGDRRFVRALNVNSMDEVPDSSWFTNRIGYRSLSTADVARGPDTSNGPAYGPLTVVAVKTDGVTPGFQLTDSTGQRYFVKFDPPGHPEMASAAEVISTKLFHALGYHVPENYIATRRRDDFLVRDGATFKGSNGKKRPLTSGDLDAVLQLVARGPDGSYRMLASRALQGTPVGPFQYHGTRPDDPNDVVPHEHRRELRGLRVFAAWLDHIDTKEENSLDTLITTGPRAIVRHHLLDFGSTLGSGGVGRIDRRDGFEYAFDSRAALLALGTFGLYVPPWQRATYPDLPSLGLYGAEHFRPERWKPTLPNPAFQNARLDDTFWAAQRVVAFSDEAIRAAVSAGCLSDPRASSYLAQTIIERRNQIGRYYLTAINPVVRPAIDDSGVLTFGNAAIDRGVATPPTAYEVKWAVYDNTTGRATDLGQAERRPGPQFRVPEVPDGSEYLRVDISATHPAHPSWATPVRVFFRNHHDSGWRTVGLERLF